MKLETPYFLLDEEAISRNLSVLDHVQKEAFARILLAQKAYSVYQTYPQIAEKLAGTTSSGLYEARLAAEEFHPIRGREEDFTAGDPGETRHDREIHVYEPAYLPDEMRELVTFSDHIVFNSLTQLEVHRPAWSGAREKGLHIGLRLNPEISTQEDPIYDPCAPGSRLGIRKETLDAYAAANDGSLPNGVDGLHFHTLCEQGFPPLERTWREVERKFGKYLLDPQITWVDLGGGHHITKMGYDLNGLIRLVKEIREKYGTEVYLEPGEAVVYEAGSLFTTVLDIVETDELPVLILDTSAACHMPDVLEMPYTPPLRGARAGTGGKFPYRLSSRTCLAGDIIGDYSFDHEVRVGDRLEFLDMALYTMVKTNTFNGTALPAIAIKHPDGEVEALRLFGYRDFKERL